MSHVFVHVHVQNEGLVCKVSAVAHGALRRAIELRVGEVFQWKSWALPEDDGDPVRLLCGGYQRNVVRL